VTVHIAVADPLPLYRQGVVTVLSAAGHVVETPSDVVAWARQTPTAIVILTVLSERDWKLLERLTATDASCGVIALVETAPAAAGVRAVRSGARCVLAREVSTEMLRRAVEAVIEGHSVMPSDVAAALATNVPEPAPPTLTPEELSWLRQLSGGITVARLAERAGYSERAMFRLLRSVYRSMGVDGRMAAVLRAQERGWL
jgi:DNA-binding NarL/FixJ family response regulator